MAARAPREPRHALSSSPASPRALPSAAPDEAPKDTAARLLRQNRVLLELASGHVTSGRDLRTALRSLTQAAAETLGVERASVWLYNATRDCITCFDLYEARPGRHTEGAELKAAMFPAYFAALEEERTIAAHEARADPRTREFRETYLEPLGITSMLDAPIRFRGMVIGVLCHEHVGPARRWSAEEEAFAASLGDLASLAFATVERERAEESLRLQGKVLESMVEGVTLTDEAGLVQFANPAADVMFGCAQGGLLGKPLASLLDPALGDGQERMAVIAAALCDEGRWQGELQQLRLGGAPFITEVRVTPLVLPGKAYWVVMHTDITERRLASERLREAHERLLQEDQRKAQFLNNVAHELRTPLTPIALQLQILKADLQDEAHRHNVVILERNMNRLATLVEDILDVARLQSSRFTVHRAPLDLDGVVAEVAETFQESARRARIALDVDLGGVGLVQGDAPRISQVLFNLLTNALKFTPAGGRIAVATRRADGEAILEVRDTGIGLAPEQLQRLFQPFTQVHKPDEVKTGTGLGLYISRGIAEQHGGSIACTSEGPGKGATFRVTLPLVARRQEAKAGEHEERARAR